MRWIGRHAHGSESEVIAHGRPTCSQRTGPTQLHHFVVRRACAMASALFPHAYLTVNREAALLMRELVNSRVVGNPEVMWHVPRGGLHDEQSGSNEPREGNVEFIAASGVSA